MHSYPRIAVTGVLAALLLIGGIAEVYGKPTAANDTTKISLPSPGGAALRSLLFPGWGQTYNGSPVKAVIYGGIEEGIIYGIYRNHLSWRYYVDQGSSDYAEHFRQQRNRLAWYLAGTIIASMVDAYVDASLAGYDVSDDLSLGWHRDNFMNSGVNVTVGWTDPALLTRCGGVR